ncbi:hypothetical protein GLE_4659 [Lysobacter enzymogenes]|uniref:Uncharacterized protein n=1 Tax=Lysobacter enzymogenes TaxID=69 RepID=A0A0S2DN81_LYSEN|nr:hypothetical protein GLE_4659 [Lysobacter enzymogenes]
MAARRARNWDVDSGRGRGRRLFTEAAAARGICKRRSS